MHLFGVIGTLMFLIGFSIICLYVLEDIRLYAIIDAKLRAENIAEMIFFLYRPNFYDYWSSAISYRIYC